MKTKVCSKCKLDININDFYSDLSRKDGLSYICKQCGKKRLKIYYEKNRKKMIKYSQQYRQENFLQVAKYQKEYRYKNRHKKRKYSKEYYRNNLAKIMLKSSKYHAKQRNFEHCITEKDIQQKLDKCKNENGEYICPVFGIKICVNSKLKYNSISLDRINPNKGYVPNNISVISWKANNIKNTGTAIEHLKIYYYMIENI